MGDEFSLEDAIIILRRRFFYFLLPVLVIAPLGALVVMLLPAQYTAKGTILVESQQIPTEFVRSTISAYAQERIQTIQQRVMTRNTLLTLADKYTLFPAALGLSESERVDRMRNRLKVDLINSGLRRPGVGENTIAFTVSYTDRNPDKAFQVANDIMTLFLEEDVRSRTVGASNTTEFFEREANRLRNAVAALETQIADFKKANGDALPEHRNLYLDMLERANADLSTTQTAASQLAEEQRFLENQMVAGAGADGGMAQELARLEAELARLRATYRDNYPEVIAKRDEIASIRAQMTPSREIRNLREALSDAERKLSDLENAATPDETAIAAAEREVEAARDALSDRITFESSNGAPASSNAQVEGRLAVVNNRIRMMRKDEKKAEARIATLEEQIGRIPEVERGLAGLTRDYDNLFREYQDVLAKQQDAQLSENLEENQQAEKFSILEPPLRPETPTSPNRPVLFLLALVTALGVGGAAAIAVELLLATVRGRNHLASLIGGAPIAVIPYIENGNERSFVPSLKKRRSAPREPAPEPA